MGRFKDIEKAIRQRDAKAIMQMMFEVETPKLKAGYCSENELWDFKADCPRPGKKFLHAWADLAREIMGFHNQKGGLLFFGIRDHDCKFIGATNRLDSKLLNDQVRKFLGDRVWIEFYREFIQADQTYLGLALVPPRGAVIERFKRDAPRESKKGPLFKKGFSAVREGDSTRILSEREANELSRSLSVPVAGKVYEVDEPFYRILCPEYSYFVIRKDCELVEKTIRDRRTTTAAITGIGGVGKTALGTWCALRAYERKDFGFIVSLTAKDRELTSAGIRALKPDLTSFEALLNGILEVLQFPDMKNVPIREKEFQVKQLIEDSNGLLYVDNLETVDDTRIIDFLDNLPEGVHAITTSRFTKVKVSARPIDLGPFSDEEVLSYMRSISRETRLKYISELSEAEILKIGQACDCLPLAIRWALTKANSSEEALVIAETIGNQGSAGEELLEFIFRGIFATLPAQEKAILQVISMFQRPMALEAILVGAATGAYRVQDAIDLLQDYALIQAMFDSEINDYVYTMLPITRNFVYKEVRKESQFEERTRKRLSDYFEAKDVRDPSERAVVRELRQGTKGADSALLDLAKAAQRRGDNDGARDLYEQAVTRDSTSWRAARDYAEFCRHVVGESTTALRLYDKAAANAPRHGPERALIFRERGMLYRDSGFRDGTELAIENFKAALEETPNDPVCIHALAHMYKRKGAWNRVIRLLEPLADHPNERTREKTLPLLLEAYEYMGEIVKVAETKAKMQNKPFF
jgi:tetratricopeptide (TPR) repeat protein